jgi:hypothetical protein
MYIICSPEIGTGWVFANSVTEPHDNSFAATLTVAVYSQTIQNIKHSCYGPKVASIMTYRVNVPHET